MHIGYFTSIEGWGGSETYLQSLICGVRERGHDVTLFGVDGTRLWQEMQACGVPCVATSGPAPRPNDASRGAPAEARSSGNSAAKLRGFVPGWVKLWLGSMREVRGLAECFRAHRVDVMHVSVSGYEVAGLACRRVSIPTLAMNMVTPPDEPYWLRRRLMRHTQRRYDHVSSQSAFCTQRWACLAGLDAAHCSHVWNGADLSRYRPRTNGQVRRPESAFRLVSLGRLHPMKGYGTLIDAVCLLADSRARVTVYGEGAQRAGLEQKIEKNGLAGQIKLPGYSEDPAQVLREADAFVLPSVSHESCPAVLAQAMAAALPLITSDFGPLAEVNLHEQTGLVVPVGDPDALAAAIRRLADHPDQAARMAGRAHQRAATHFSLEHMIDRTLALYRSVFK